MPEYVLGIDLGANSVGWALFESEGGGLTRLVRTGVRVFEAGADGDIESGREEPRNAKRRAARQHRRQLRRRAGRMRELASVLQQHELLPAGNVKSELERHHLLLNLDRQLAGTADATNSEVSFHLHAYRLRARALDERLEPWSVGRALYHLAQRRGYKSNRKTEREDDEDQGTVKPAIAELARRTAEAGARTLGEFFSRIDPREERIRGRWTSRAMYEAEFDAIWTAQAAHHPGLLTAEARKAIERIIFHQRPLRTQKHLIGKCPYEPKRQRAPLALLTAQRFRLLQQVNHTELISPEGEVLPLTPEQRSTLLDALENQGDLTFAKAKKCIGLSKNHDFTIASGDEDRFIGNRTAAKLIAVFGERYASFAPEERNRIVEDLLSMENEAALARRGVRAWGLDEAQAAQFAAIHLEPGYTRLSRQAIAKLLPLMEAGKPYMTAVKEAYGVRRESPRHDKLPPVVQALPGLRNPVVSRCLTELRKVVNGVVREYGKPAVIRVELARDVKNTAKERKRIAKQNIENRGARAKAAERIQREVGNPHPSRRDIEKVLLAQECNFECPYTGKHFGMRDLFGEAPQFDIEHIIPYSRCLDNSFLNKTLCYNEENRNVKGGRTPFEAYGSSDGRWKEILDRIKRFQGTGRDAKLQRFRLESLESFDDFTERQLNDTRHASREACEYLGLLYGGAIDPDGKRRVQVSRGKVTADLRNAWRLNEILGDGAQKERGDHRHHAVDAMAIALADAGMIRRVSQAAELAEKNRSYRWWRNLEMPWKTFLDDARAAIEATIVSHRPSRDVRGPLHDETLYSKPRELDNGNTVVHVRKPVHALTLNEVEDIVDPVVRAIVKEALGDRDPKKAFAARDSVPFLTARDGRRIPIRCVRVRKSAATIKLGSGPSLRHVVPGANHHIEIFETTNAKGNTKWDARMVPLWEACERLRKKQPVVQRDHGKDRKFVFALAPGDMFTWANDSGSNELFVLRSISQNKAALKRFEFVTATDARKKKDIISAKAWKISFLNELLRRDCQKVTVSTLGEIVEAND